MPAAMSLHEQFDKYVLPEPNSGCWFWLGTLNNKGYGRIPIKNKMALAHRVFYKAFKNEIPKGLDLDHLCRVRCCVNPAHLEPVTRQVNCLRGETGHAMIAAHRNKTHCPQGHPYSVENTWRNPKKNERQCRICARLRALEYHYKNRARRLQYMRKANKRRLRQGTK